MVQLNPFKRKRWQEGNTLLQKGAKHVKKQLTDDKGVSSLWYGEKKRENDKKEAEKQAKKDRLKAKRKAGLMGSGKQARKNRNQARNAEILKKRRQRAAEKAKNKK